MIKNRSAVNSVKLSKRPIRPSSSGNCQPKKPIFSGQINRIISSLERNVKDLKTYYHNREEKQISLSLQKKNNNFRLKKVLRRNSSQANLTKTHSNKINEENQIDRNGSDIFEVKNFYYKIHGRDTNNIIELYQFYKKHIEKRDKSTRILASIDISNPNMGLSLDVGKQSLLRQEQYQRKEKDGEHAIEQKLELSDKADSSNKLQNTLSRASKGHERPSMLANELMSKGLYSVANLTHMMMNKRYKLTKQKEESLEQAQKQREKITSLKLQSPKQNNANIVNVQHHKEPFHLTQLIEQQKITELKSNQISEHDQLNRNVSFNQPNQSLSSIHSQCRDRSKKSPEKPFEISSIKKVEGLEQSPIMGKKGKDFVTSKYYVQPIPVGKKVVQQQKSITLKSNSRIIDLDLMPFDL